MSRLIFLLTLILTVSASSFGTTIHVPDDQPSIQAGLNYAVEGDTVLVAAGTYFENIIWPSMNGIKLIGSGEEDCIIDGDSLASVIRFEEELSGVIDTTTVVTGFTIQNGYARQDSVDYDGGGIYCYASSPCLINVSVLHNSAYWQGGGIYCFESDPYLQNVNVSNNSAFGGGGICCESYSNPTLVAVTVNDNSALTHGGGIRCSGDPSNLNLTTGVIASNTAYAGGGIYGSSSNLSITDTGIYSNSATTLGGGIFLSGSEAHLLEVEVSGNAAEQGGGIYINHSNATFLNVTLTQNIADGEGDEGGGMQCSYEAHPILEGCIVWNNIPQQVSFKSSLAPSSFTISCSDIQGGEEGIETNDNGTVYWLENNIDADPLFCDQANDDYRLQLDSPCRTDVCGFMGYTGETCDGEGVEDLATEPSGFYLADAYPNPFNPSTTIDYSIGSPSDVTLSLYNIQGQLVDVIHDGFMQAGQHSATWTPSDLSSGVYLVELRAGVQRDVIKVMYVK